MFLHQLQQFCSRRLLWAHDHVDSLKHRIFSLLIPLMHKHMKDHNSLPNPADHQPLKHRNDKIRWWFQVFWTNLYKVFWPLLLVSWQRNTHVSLRATHVKSSIRFSRVLKCLFSDWRLTRSHDHQDQRKRCYEWRHHSEFCNQKQLWHYEHHLCNITNIILMINRIEIMMISE